MQFSSFSKAGHEFSFFSARHNNYMKWLILHNLFLNYLMLKKIKECKVSTWQWCWKSTFEIRSWCRKIFLDTYQPLWIQQKVFFSLFVSIFFDLIFTLMVSNYFYLFFCFFPFVFHVDRLKLTNEIRKVDELWRSRKKK